MGMADCIACPTRRSLQQQLDDANARIARMEAEINDVRRMYHADGPDTSKDAAYSLDRESLDQRVLRAIRDAGHLGLTAQECASSFDTFPSNLSGSFTRLKRGGVIILGGKRKNPQTDNFCEYFLLAPGAVPV